MTALRGCGVSPKLRMLEPWPPGTQNATALGGGYTQQNKYDKTTVSINYLNNTTNQINLIKLYGTLPPTPAEDAIVFQAHRMVTHIGHVLSHNI